MTQENRMATIIDDAIKNLPPHPVYENWLNQLVMLKAVGWSDSEAEAWCMSGASYTKGECKIRWGTLPKMDFDEACKKIWVQAKAHGWTPPAGNTPRLARRPRQDYTPPEIIPLYATPAPAGFTALDIQKLPIWFCGLGKKGFTMTWKGVTYGWRQSKPEADGGIGMARYGGDVQEKKLGTEQTYPVTVKPWQDYAAIQTICEWAKNHNRLGARPVIGMGGDKKNPAPHSLLILDVDYHPEKDKDGIGKQYRDALQKLLVEDNFSIYSSTSGNGYHGVGLVDEAYYDRFLVNGMTKRKIATWKPYLDEMQTGVAVDIFLPSAPFLVALNLHRPIANADGNDLMPKVTPDDLNRYLTLGQG